MARPNLGGVAVVAFWLTINLSACSEGNLTAPTRQPGEVGIRREYIPLGDCPYYDTRPTGPASVSGTVQSNGTLLITWAARSGAVAYRVSRMVYIPWEGYCVEIPFEEVGGTSYVMSYLPDGTFTNLETPCYNDFYSVRAKFADGSWSRLSGCVDATLVMN